MQMRKANLEAYKLRKYGFGWAVYDVDLSDTNMTCSETRFARLESIRTQIDEALKGNSSSGIKWW